MKLILLTVEQTEKVRGRHGKYSALDPIAMDNGMFILPIEVMDDPEHKETLNDLGGCKYANVDIHLILDPKRPEDELKLGIQTLSVNAISPLVIAVENEMTVKPAYIEVIKSE